MTIQELREKRAKAWDTARDFLDSKRQAEIEADMAKATTSPILTAPAAQNTEPEKTGTASAAYSDAFWNSIRNRNWIDVRNDLHVGTDTEGGYLVPDEFERKLIEALEEENIFRQMATVIKTSSGDRKIPIVTSKGDAVWMDEEEQYTLSDGTFGQASLSAYKLGTAIKISEELLNDSVFDLPSYIAREFARRIGAKEEEAFFIGNGTGKPTGIFNATGGAQDGNGNYIWQPSVATGVPDTILNRPYKTSSYVPEIGAGKKCMAFGDFSYYWIADRSGRTFKRLNELFAMTGQVGFLAMERLDGKLILPEAIKTLKVKSGSGA